jgi:hypothetical protein
MTTAHSPLPEPGKFQPITDLKAVLDKFDLKKAEAASPKECVVFPYGTFIRVLDYCDGSESTIDAMREALVVADYELRKTSQFERTQAHQFALDAIQSALALASGTTEEKI